MEKVKVYLWRVEAATGFTPARAGQVTVEGNRLAVEPGSEARIGELAASLRERESLPLRVETMRREGAQQVLELAEVEVKPGDEGWGYALGEAIAREGGYAVSYTPDFD